MRWVLTFTSLLFSRMISLIRTSEQFFLLSYRINRINILSGLWRLPNILLQSLVKTRVCHDKINCELSSSGLHNTKHYGMHPAYHLLSLDWSIPMKQVRRPDHLQYYPSDAKTCPVLWTKNYFPGWSIKKEPRVPLRISGLIPAYPLGRRDVLNVPLPTPPCTPSSSGIF